MEYFSEQYRKFVQLAAGTCLLIFCYSQQRVRVPHYAAVKVLEDNFDGVVAAIEELCDQ